MKHLFNFNDDWTSIGVKLSGGADSAIMYYAICDYFKDRDDVKIYPMTLDTQFKNWYSKGAKRIIAKVTELTGKSPQEHIVKYSKKHTNRQTADWYIKEQKNLIIESHTKFNFDAVYNGLTSNPVEEDFLEFIRQYYLDDKLFELTKKHIVTRDFDRDLGKNKYGQNVIDTGHFINIRPFVHGDKKLISEVYKYYNRLDDLYPLSYSCETRWQEHKLEQKHSHEWKHCGYCFFCAERIYAFGKLE